MGWIEFVLWWFVPRLSCLFYTTSCISFYLFHFILVDFYFYSVSVSWVRGCWIDSIARFTSGLLCSFDLSWCVRFHGSFEHSSIVSSVPLW